MVFILRVNAIPVGGLTAQELALPLEDVQRAADLGTRIGCIKVVKYIFEYRHLLGAVGILCGIVLVVHRDEAHAHPREDLFEITACLGIVAPQPREIAYKDAPHAAIHQAGGELLEAGALKIGAGVAVIHKFPSDQKVIARRPLGEESALVLNGI